MKKVLFSVSNKSGLTKFAGHLLKKNWQIISTGGTFKELKKEFPTDMVISVEDYTNSDEFIGGRVKTLNPIIHGGILAKSDQFDEIIERGIDPIHMVVCNLYPFEDTVSSIGVTEDVAIENIDIGGVTMLRGAAKNHKRVTVVSDPNDYYMVMEALDAHNNEIPENLRRDLAISAFKMTAVYDSKIAEWLSNGEYQSRHYEKVSNLKYGCNPHQSNSAVWNIRSTTAKSSVAERSSPFEVLNGNPSYINYLDAIGSWQLVNDLSKLSGYPAAASFKHTSPAGAAIGAIPLTKEEELAYEIENKVLTSQALAYVRARNGDPKSSFGDFIACSSPIDIQTAKVIKNVVSDGIIAPSFTDEAFDILKKKKGGNYIMLRGTAHSGHYRGVEFRELYGMALSQQPDHYTSINHQPDESTIEDFGLNTDTDGYGEFDTNERLDILVANVSLKYAQSNSVAFATNGQIVGLGCGQQNRVDCVKLAGAKSETYFYRLANSDLLLKWKSEGFKKQERVNKMYDTIDNFKETLKSPFSNGANGANGANDVVKSLVLASDGFFPFADNIHVAKKYNVTCIVQPGGSNADLDIDSVCKQLNIKHIKTGKRLFYH